MMTNEIDAKHVPSVHNPSNFEPSDYEVVDYLDNRRPMYCGGTVEAYEAEVEFWKSEIARVFGNGDFTVGVKKIHRCAHCGNGRVRWIAAVLHVPTREVVAFGSECVNRLGFKDRAAFKLAQIQAKAEAIKARFVVWNKRTAYLEAHPEVVAALAEMDNPVHARNSFAVDIVGKLNHWGDLSDKQAAALVASLKRDHEFAAKRAAEATEVKGDAPSGRQTVTGEVLSIKEYEGGFGYTYKMLVKLDNNSRVFVSKPSGHGIERGWRITFTATFTPKDDDKSFAFGKRPIFIRREV